MTDKAPPKPAIDPARKPAAHKAAGKSATDMSARQPAADAAIRKPPAPPRITTVTQGEELIRHFSEVMNALLRILEKETEMVRAGRVREATSLEANKAELSRLYLADVESLKRNANFLHQNLPESLQVLRRQHDDFYAILQINLTVLATAHAVAEGIIRGVADQVSRKSAPRLYGQSGRQTVPGTTTSSPVAVSRKS
jgi:hypothetical protein